MGDPYVIAINTGEELVFLESYLNEKELAKNYAFLSGGQKCDLIPVELPEGKLVKSLLN